MAGEIVTTKQQELGSLGFAGLPAIISAAGERASFRFIEFFTANIRNPNTRVSYGRAVREFCQWAEHLNVSSYDHRIERFELEAIALGVASIVAGWKRRQGKVALRSEFQRVHAEVGPNARAEVV